MKNYNILNILSQSKSVCLISHIEPDADALSSMIVLREFIKKHFKINKVDIFAETQSLPNNLKQILGTVKLNKKTSNYHTAIMIDCPNTDRLGCYKNLYENAKLKFSIDHHSSNLKINKYDIVELCSSTCEIIYSILKYFKFPISKSNQAKLYAGLITDTGNFSFGNITDKTFKIASEFNSNINRNEIYKAFFNNNSLKNLQLLSLAIQNITSFDHGKIIISHISKEENANYKANFQDYVGIINKIANINTSLLTCLIETRDDKYYVSMRSKNNLDISSIAKKQGGGGHKCAAAFISSDSLKEIEQFILIEFRKILQKYSNNNYQSIKLY